MNKKDQEIIDLVHVMASRFIAELLSIFLPGSARVTVFVRFPEDEQSSLLVSNDDNAAFHRAAGELITNTPSGYTIIRRDAEGTPVAVEPPKRIH